MSTTRRRIVTRGIVRWTGPRPVDDDTRCDDCRRILVAQRVWSAWPQSYRTQVAETHARQSVAGRCNQCVQRRRRGNDARPVAKCGTRSGAERHRRLGELVCDDCLTADNAYKRERARIARLNKKAA